MTFMESKNMMFVIGDDEFVPGAYMFTLHKGDRFSLASSILILFIWAYVWYTNKTNVYLRIYYQLEKKIVTWQIYFKTVHLLGRICDVSISWPPSFADILSAKLISYNSLIVFLQYFDLSVQIVIWELH